MKATKQYSIILELTQEEAAELAAMLISKGSTSECKLRRDIYLVLTGNDISILTSREYSKEVHT